MNDLPLLWSSFLDEWPSDRVRSMTLEEYTNLNRSDAFVYWLEKTTEKLGSIWGGNAFKWGIYHRNPDSDKPGAAGTMSDETYSWYKRYGNTAEEAFRTIRERLVEVVQAAHEGDLERIEGTDVCWPMVKWKVAFLYQNRKNPRIFPVYRDDRLLEHYRLMAPGVKSKDVSRAVMYPTLLDRYSDRGDVFDVAKLVWGDGETPAGTRYWAVPLHVALSVEEATKLCELPEVNPEDLTSLIHEMLADAEVRLGDRLALLVGDTVRAVGEMESAEPEVYAWKQRAVEVVPDLTAVPAKVAELDASERESIWGAVAQEPAPGEVQYWKISPGREASLWTDWREEGYVAIGWSRLGDVSKLDRESFEKRMRELQEEDDYGVEGPRQVWRFRHIPVGSRVLVNQGTRKILGVGTVTGQYEFHPEAEHPHRLAVEWDDLTERTIERGGWRKTLIQLDEAEFLSLTQPEPEGEVQPEDEKPSEAPVLPCPEPQSLILFGPPGTGKTWATMTRALELLFPPEEVTSWTDDTRSRQFREQQRQGRIEFVTFHQAYGYEEFVEGIRPVMAADATEQVRYELHPGAFKRIALLAAAEGLREPGALATSEVRFTRLWTELCRRVEEGELASAKSQQGLDYKLSISKRESLIIERSEGEVEGDSSGGRQTASKVNALMLWRHRSDLGPVDSWTYEMTAEVFRTERGTGGGHHYTAFWIAMKLMSELEVEIPTGKDEQAIDKLVRVQAALDRRQGGTVDFRFTAQTPPYVLIIDEINRGNISKILGELITLLEPDKRLGAANELKLPLAYSPQHRFAVPPNLHVIGTMNTADRSIALMDVALRRRFRFEEVLPQTGIIRRVLSRDVPDKPLIDLICDVFDTMNARIRQVFDRDHQIGHAYFLKVRSLSDLRDVFADRVIPLLQEYFYGAWERVCVVLGCPYDEDGTPLRSGPCVDAAKKRYRAPIIVAVADDMSVLGFDDEYGVAVDLRVSTTFRPTTATGEREEDGLLDHFLGLLNLDTDAWQQRAAAFAEAHDE